jgi:hypothetical protein
MTMMQPRAAEGFALPPAFCVDIDKLFFSSSEHRVISEQKSLSRRTRRKCREGSRICSRSAYLLQGTRAFFFGDSREKSSFGKKGKFRV